MTQYDNLDIEVFRYTWDNFDTELVNYRYQISMNIKAELDDRIWDHLTQIFYGMYNELTVRSAYEETTT